jgi:hypothetical protein
MGHGQAHHISDIQEREKQSGIAATTIQRLSRDSHNDNWCVWGGKFGN